MPSFTLAAVILDSLTSNAAHDWHILEKLSRKARPPRQRTSPCISRILNLIATAQQRRRLYLFIERKFIRNFAAKRIFKLVLT